MKMDKTMVIGLTGQTGAGKSTVCRFAEEMGIPVISADKVAREVTDKGSRCLEELARVFGEDILLPDGGLNRKALAAKAFADKNNTDLLNRVTHPYIIERTRQNLEELSKEGAGLVIFDAPQLFESGADKLCDIIAAVTAPEELRLDRIMKRDGITEEEARRRMKAQLSEEFFRDNCRYVIDGSRSLTEVRQQANELFLSAEEGKAEHSAHGQSSYTKLTDT